MSYEDVLIRESVGDGTVDPDDVCMVCDKRDCICPPEEPEEQQADVIVQNETSIFILWPITKTGTKWLEANAASAQRWGVNGFVIEHRYVRDIVKGMIRDGLKVATGSKQGGPTP